MSDDRNYEEGQTKPLDHDEQVFFMDIHAERARQINMGYTAEHDKIGGIKHLVKLSIDYIYHNEKIKAAAVVLAILELYRTRNERKWFLTGILVGACAAAVLIFFMGIIFINVTRVK